MKKVIIMLYALALAIGASAITATKAYVDGATNATLTAAKAYTDAHGGGSGGAVVLHYTRSTQSFLETPAEIARLATTNQPLFCAVDTNIWFKLDNVVLQSVSGVPTYNLTLTCQNASNSASGIYAPWIMSILCAPSANYCVAQIGAASMLPDSFTSMTNSVSFRNAVNSVGMNEDAVRVIVGEEMTNKTSVAIGYNAKATGNYSTAIGSTAKAYNNYNVSIGSGAFASGIWSTAIGYGASATGTTSLAVGWNTIANGDSATAIGLRATAGQSGVALGCHSTAGYDSSALGSDNEATGTRSVAAGCAPKFMSGDWYEGKSKAKGRRSIAMGGHVESGDDGISLGYAAYVTNANAVVISTSEGNSRSTFHGSHGVGTITLGVKDSNPEKVYIGNKKLNEVIEERGGKLPNNTLFLTNGTVKTKSGVGISPANIGAATSNEVEDVKAIVSTWEGFLDGSNVVFSITNYISGAYNLDTAKLRILEMRDGEYREVYNSRGEIVMHLGQFETNVVNAKIADVDDRLAGKADKAWGKYTSSGGVAPSNTVYMTAPSTVFAGGMEYERVAVGEGAVCILTTKGAPTYTTGDEGTFKFQDDGGTNYFGFAKSDSYTLGCDTDGITVTTNIVTLLYNVTMSGTPCVWYKQSLEDNTPWERLNTPDGNPIPGASKVVTWDDNPDPGTKVCYLNCSEPSGFFKATIEVAGMAKFMTNMPADLQSGIFCTNTVNNTQGIIKPSYNGSQVIWTWSAQ